MDKFFYQAKGGKWQVAIIIEMEYCFCDDVIATDNLIKAANQVYFENLANSASKIALTEEESAWFCYGLQLCASYLVKIQKESKNILFRLHNIHFSDCCIQKEAFAHAAIQWVEDTFGIIMPKVVVSFDNTLGYHGMYCFDFSQFL